MKRFLIPASCVLACLMILASCRKGPDRDIEKKIYVTHSSLNLIEGDEIQITASPTDQTFSWQSVNPDIVTVSQTGLVNAIKDGISGINITSSGGLQRTIPVNVAKYIPLDGIDVFEPGTVTVTTSLSVKISETSTVEAAPTPKNYNERVPFKIIWESSDESIVKIDAVSGLITPVDLGEAEIMVSVVDKPSVKKVIPIEIIENPITDIQVPESLDLMLKRNFTVTPELLPANYGMKDPSLVWKSSDESIVQVNNGELIPVGLGEVTISVSLNSNPNVKSEIVISVAHLALQRFTSAGSNLLQTRAYLVNDEEITTIGIDRSTFGTAYNRDFMSYDTGTGNITFIGETGEWDVYYSSMYNYFWVARMSDVAPACYWIVGAGFACPPVWHSDFNSGGWSTSNMRQMAYMRSIGDGKYQATIYIGVGGFDFCVYANRAWGGQIYEPTLTGPPGIILHAGTKGDLVEGDGFVPGYFRFTFDQTNWAFIFEDAE